MQDTSTSLNGVVSAMATDVGVLGNTQSNLTSIQTQLSDTSTALSGQLSNVQDVDMATTLSSLTATQTQLQASYRLITAETSLSLVNFLPATCIIRCFVHLPLTFFLHHPVEPAKGG